MAVNLLMNLKIIDINFLRYTKRYGRQWEDEDFTKSASVFQFILSGLQEAVGAIYTKVLGGATSEL